MANRYGPRLAEVLAVVLASGCCTRTETLVVPVRHRVVVGHAPERKACVARCLPLRADSELTYWKCLSRCPGYAATPRARCGPDDRLPRAECATTYQTTTRQRIDERRGLAAFVLGAFAGAAATITLVATGASAAQRQKEPQLH